MTATTEGNRMVPVSHVKTLDAIAELLDRREWKVDDLETIAEMVRGTGRPIRGPQDVIVAQLVPVAEVTFDPAALTLRVSLDWCDSLRGEVIDGDTGQTPQGELVAMLLDRHIGALSDFRFTVEADEADVPDGWTIQQFLAIRNLCRRYGVDFDPEHYKPGFDLPPGYLQGWIGGPRQEDRATLFVGCSPEGVCSS